MTVLGRAAATAVAGVLVVAAAAGCSSTEGAAASHTPPSTGAAVRTASRRLSVHDVAVGATHATDTAAYLRVDNPTDDADRLVAVTSPDATSITMHESDDRGGVSEMRRVDALAVPARGSLRLDPGGSHLMVSGVRAPVEAGDAVRLHLVFDHAPAVEVTAVAVPLQDLPERVARR